MNAILLSLALLGQFDMGGRSSDSLMMDGSVPSRASEFLMGGDTPLAAGELRVRGVMITASWCQHCRAFKANEVPRLIAGGWKVGDREADHLQLIDVEKSPVPSLPVFIRMVDGKEVARRVGSMDALQVAEFIYPKKSLAAGDESAPTPTREVERVLDLLPKPAVAFVDFGCGDGRWLFAAVERWNCKAVGVEIDPARAAATSERVQAAGLSDRITIITGDSTTTDVEADVGVAYLYGDVLEQLRPRIEKLRAFASFRHQPPGLPVVRNGDSWIYVRGTQTVQQSGSAVWQGQYYSQPVCSDPNCAMCRSIRRQLNSGVSAPPKNSIWWSLF